MSGSVEVTPSYPSGITPTSRNLNDWAGDVYNLRFLGAKLDGSSGDGAAIQAAYEAVPSGSIIEVPTGNWPIGFDITSNPAKTVMWRLLGTLDYGPGTSPGTAPVVIIGQNTVTVAYNKDQFVTFSKKISTTSNTDPVVSVEYTNDCNSVPLYT